MRLVFMGTPDFAVPSLKILLDSDHDVVGVVTTPDKPAGRGKKMYASAIKRTAFEHKLPLLQPEKFRDEKFLEHLRSWNADLFVIVAFRILPDIVFTLPPKGAFNLHASLLPKYRGAAPINWALINGEQESGVTTFFLDRNVDTGQILLQQVTALTENTTAGELHDRLSQIGSELVLQTVNYIDGGDCQPQKQKGEPTKAPKLTPELGRLAWSNSAQLLHNLIRGLSPFPGGYCVFREKRLKILESRIVDANAAGSAPGTIIAVEKHGPIRVQTGNGILALHEVKPEGKKQMTADEFARGSRIEIGEKLE